MFTKLVVNKKFKKKFIRYSKSHTINHFLLMIIMMINLYVLCINFRFNKFFNLELKSNLHQLGDKKVIEILKFLCLRLNVLEILTKN